MSFPENVLPVKVELDLDGWVEVTPDLTARKRISITRGRSDEGNDVDRSTADFEIKNPDGIYSPRNPNSPYYGVLGRNTPTRISVPGERSIIMSSADIVSTPDAAALDIVGDLDVRVELQRNDWYTTGCDLIGKYEPTGNQRSWAFYFSNFNGVNGKLAFAHTPTGSGAVQSFSSIAIPFPAGDRMAVRATIDVDNGASGYTITFYWADSIAGPWSVLGEPVIVAGTTSLFNSTAVMKIGDSGVSGGWGGPNPGRMYAIEVRNGINGTVVSSWDSGNLTAGSPTFTDDQGATWTLAGTSEISDRNYRFYGEVASWPQRWDKTGTDVSSVVQASGLLRRLGATSESAGSAWKRAITKQYTSLVAYWPFEDQQNSQTVAGGLDDTPDGVVLPAAQWNFDTVQFGASSEFECSNPIMVMNHGSVMLTVPTHTATGEYQVRWLGVNPETNDDLGGYLLRINFTGGTLDYVEVEYLASTGEMACNGWTLSGNAWASGSTNLGLPGTKGLFTLELTQSGGNINFAIAFLVPGAPSGPFMSGSGAATMGTVTSIVTNPYQGSVAYAMGHVTLQTDVTSLYDFSTQLNSWRSEKAGNRIKRICSEESIPFRAVGDMDETATVGAQPIDTVLGILRDCSDVDLGMIFEPRDMFGLGYRSRVSLLNQSPQILTAYTDSTLSEAPTPTDDDQAIANDVTANRIQGSQSRAQLLVGPLSVQSPPNGVGRYAVAVSINVNNDGQLLDQASWRMRLGTDDNPRYPQLQFDMARDQVVSDTALTDSIAGANVGDLIRITDPPAFMPPRNIDQIIEGWVETMANFEWRFSFNCSPGTSQTTGQYQNSSGDSINGYTWRYQPTATLLGEDLDTTETGIDINVSDDALWTTTVDDYPFDIVIGGERMTVTACSGASSPQTLTVTRSVNGVVKSHTTGAAIELVDIAVYGM